MQVRSGQMAANRFTSVGSAHCPKSLPEVQDGFLLAAVTQAVEVSAVLVSSYLHGFHLPSLQTNSRVVVGLLSPPGTGGAHQSRLTSGNTHLPLRSASARKWASSTKKILAPLSWASSRIWLYWRTKAFRSSSLAFRRRFLGRFSTKPNRLEVVQATAPTQPQIKAPLEPNCLSYFPIPVGQFNSRLSQPDFLHRRLQLVLFTPAQDGGEHPQSVQRPNLGAPARRKLASQYSNGMRRSLQSLSHLDRRPPLGQR